MGKSNTTKRVLVVATSRKTRGGITAVIKAHETGEQWKKFHCYWVQTHRDGPSWRKLLYLISGMADFLIRLPFYDIVHIHTADYGTQKRKRIFTWIAKTCGKKLIVHLHSSGVEYSIGGESKQLYSNTFNYADKIIALSKTWKADVMRLFNISGSKIEILYNPCPKVIPSSISERQKYILFAGTLTHRKGFDDLIKAFADIKDKFPGWRLKLAGNGDIEQGKYLAKTLCCADSIDFLGWLNGEDKDNAFRKAAAYCLPSYSEGFPMGVLDAWAYHLPVITTPVGGVPDVAIDGENILLFNPGDVSGLSKRLAMVMSNEALRTKLSGASAELAHTRFSVSQISRDLDRIYSSL
jgi:glycosyltransferase involved in cell wall biosynthesis